MKKKANSLLKILTIIVSFIIFIIIIDGLPQGFNISFLSSKFNNTAKNYEEYYEIVENNVKEYKSLFNVTIKNYDKDKNYEDVVNEVIDNNQELSGVCIDYKYSVDSLGSTANVNFSVNYSHSKKELISRDKELKSKVEEIVKEVITREMKSYEKEKALHDYLVNNCKYDERYYSGDMPMESYTAYGVLIKGVGVCQGYAVAMNMLLEKAGIDGMIITGEAYDYNSNKYDGHAWNLVNLDGQYYHLDPTWNDPVSKDGKDRVVYSYFNLSDNQIKKDHSWDENKYPVCTSTKFNYDNLNIVEKDTNGNNIITVASIDELFSYLRSDISASRSEVTYKIKNFNRDLEAVKRIVESSYQSLEKAGQYSFSCEVSENSNVGYITFNFK